MTDPWVGSRRGPGQGTAWATRRGNEVPDICEPGKHSPNRTFILHLKTGAFIMQKLWSNAAGKCVEGSQQQLALGLGAFSGTKKSATQRIRRCPASDRHGPSATGDEITTPRSYGSTATGRRSHINLAR